MPVIRRPGQLPLRRGAGWSWQDWAGPAAFVLAGSGLLHDGSSSHRLTTGMSALAGPGEVHWFENDRPGDFAFVEFWAPPPADTTWTVPADRCTWAAG